MRILQLVQRPHRRGAEVFAYDLTRRFEEVGCSVKTVYLYETDGDRPLPLHGDDVCLHGHENNVPERLSRFDPILLKRARVEIKRFAPDIVQVNGSGTVKYGAVLKRISGSNGGWKLIYRNIGIPSDWHHWWGTVFVYRTVVMPQMDGVIGVSRYSLENAQSLYRLRVPATIIMNGISPTRLTTTTQRTAFRTNLGVGEDEIVLLFVGFLDAVKRPARFIRAVADVATRVPNLRAWVLGDGPLRRDVENLARKLGVSPRIRFFGSQDDVAEYMQAADVFVMTSRTEGVPAVVLEAGFMGLPVVGTRVGGMPECVREGESGILVDPDSEAQMADAIVRLASDAGLRARMGENGREWIRKELTIEHIADRYLQFYERILEGSSPIPSHT